MQTFPENILNIAIPLILLGAGYYLKRYLTKKAENIATKEDIGEITDQIETIRKEHQSELEILKATLKLQTSQQESLLEAQRVALLAFFESTVSIITGKLDFPIQLTDSIDYNFLLEHERTVLRSFSDLQVAYFRLHLYAGYYTELNKLARQVIDRAIVARDSFKIQYAKIKQWAAQQVEVNGKKSTPKELIKTYNSDIIIKNGHIAAALEKYLDALNRFLKEQGLGTMPKKYL